MPYFFPRPPRPHNTNIDRDQPCRVTIPSTREALRRPPHILSRAANHKRAQHMHTDTRHKVNTEKLLGRESPSPPPYLRGLVWALLDVFPLPLLSGTEAGRLQSASRARPYQRGFCFHSCLCVSAECTLHLGYYKHAHSEIEGCYFTLPSRCASDRRPPILIMRTPIWIQQPPDHES